MSKNDVSDEISMIEILHKIKRLGQYLRSKWFYLLIAGLSGSALGLTYSLLNKVKYTAELSFALEDDKSSGSGIGSAMGLASQFGLDIGSNGGAFSGDNLLLLMKSRSMVEKALLTRVTIKGKTETLADYYIAFNKFRDRWLKDPDLLNLSFPVNQNRSTFTLKQDSVLGGFYNSIIKTSLYVDKADKKLSVITVKTTSENEIFSKIFTEILVNTVSDFYITTKTKKSVQNVTILQRQTDSVRRQLNSAIMGVASSIDVNPNPNPNLQILKAPAQRRQVDVSANQAILTELVKNLEFSKVSLRKETPLIQIIDAPILPLEKTKFGKLKGVVLGGFLGCFFMSLSLVVTRLYQKFKINES